MPYDRNNFYVNKRNQIVKHNCPNCNAILLMIATQAIRVLFMVSMHEWEIDLNQEDPKIIVNHSFKIQYHMIW